MACSVMAGDWGWRKERYPLNVILYLPASAADLALMRRMDELPLDYPFAGSCVIC